MKRWKFLIALFGGAAATLVPSPGLDPEPPQRPVPKKPLQKWYITGGHRESVLGDCEIPPIICYGTDRLDALANSGITVWSEAEYLEADAAFRKACESGMKPKEPK